MREELNKPLTREQMLAEIERLVEMEVDAPRQDIVDTKKRINELRQKLAELTKTKA